MLDLDDLVARILDARNDPAAGLDLGAVATGGHEGHAEIAQMLHDQPAGVAARAIDNDGEISTHGRPFLNFLFDLEFTCVPSLRGSGGS